MGRIKFSRSEQDAFWKCPRLGYLAYRANGHGWSKAGVNWDLALGSLVHDYALGLIHGAPLPLINATHEKELVENGLDLRANGTDIEEWIRTKWFAECMVRGWLKIRWPYIVQDYEPIAVEEDWDVPLDEDVAIMLRLDYFLRRHSDGALKVLDLKTTGILGQGYIDGWIYSNQTVSYLKAASERRGERVTSMILELMYKGRRERDDATGTYKRYSPFMRAYQHDETGELSWDSGVARRKAWNAVDATLLGVTPAEWVESLPIETLSDQYRTTEVYRSDVEREQWRRRAVLDFRAIDKGTSHVDVATMESTLDVVEQVLDERFPAHRSADCHEDKYRKSCPFKAVCFGEIALDEMADHYVKRVPHHKQEGEDG